MRVKQAGASEPVISTNCSKGPGMKAVGVEATLGPGTTGTHCSHAPPPASGLEPMVRSGQRLLECVVRTLAAAAQCESGGEDTHGRHSRNQHG